MRPPRRSLVLDRGASSGITTDLSNAKTVATCRSRLWQNRQSDREINLGGKAMAVVRVRRWLDAVTVARVRSRCQTRLPDNARAGPDPLRVPIWAPFRLQCYCNGHSRQARQLTAEGISFTAADNAFTRIVDWQRAHDLADGLSGASMCLTRHRAPLLRRPANRHRRPRLAPPRCGRAPRAWQRTAQSPTRKRHARAQPRHSR
jgi:hypothetical protein